MSPWVIVAIVVGFDAVLISALLYGLVHGTWKPLSDRYPAVEPEADGVRRAFQSLKMDLFNLGWSVHLTADTGHLHFEPAKVFRIVGAKAFSVPWADLRGMELRGKRWGRVTLRGTTILLPRWAAELATPENEADES